MFDRPEINELEFDKYISSLDAVEKLNKIKREVEEWVNKQGHDRCWFYPEIFIRIKNILEIRDCPNPSLPPLEEFEKGCKRYQLEEFK